MAYFLLVFFYISFLWSEYLGEGREERQRLSASGARGREERSRPVGVEAGRCGASPAVGSSASVL